MHRIVYILVLLALLLFALLVGGPMPYLLLYISILVFLVPFLHLLVSLIGLSASIKIPNSSLHVGDSINIKYNISNKNIFPLPFLKFSSNIRSVINGRDSNSKTISLGARKNFALKEKITLNRRGYYDSIQLKLKIFDIFSLFHLRRNFKTDSSLIVYPNIVKLDNFRVYSNQSLGEMPVEKSIFQDRSNISTIDKYQEGDSINRIHWKASAKRGIPMVKTFETVSDTELDIFINNKESLFQDDFDRRIEDKIVDISTAIIYYFLNLNIQVNLDTFSGQKRIEIESSRKDDLKLYLETLAKLEANGDFKMKNLLGEKNYRLDNSSILLIITPILDKELGELAMELKMKNLTPLFIVVTDKKNSTPMVDRNIEGKLLDEGIDLRFIDYASNIKEELEVRHE